MRKIKENVKKDNPLLFLLFLIVLAVLFLTKEFLLWRKKKRNWSWLDEWFFQDEKKKSNLLVCPIRGNLRSNKYDIKENRSEEYQRVLLIKFFLKKGFQQSQILVEYPVPLGHKGRRYLRVDLVIRQRKGNKVILVVEIKKRYVKAEKQSAIDHQLIPAMLLLQCNTGLYFDGSTHSCYVHMKDGSLLTKPFVF